jgi:cyclopropane fatty-acyl-phospholipid synthase-like methyltransferase
VPSDEALSVTDDPKRIVAAGYDACGARYSAARAHDPSPEIERLLETVSLDATVLDIGCGAGVPVTSALARVCRVVGVDISSVQIEQARLNIPQATFMLGDIMTMEFAPRTFDAVVSFYTLFHLPREEHRTLLERIALWLRPGGHLLATVANSSHPGYTEPDFFGATMYWSHFEQSWYASTLRELGFRVLDQGVLGHGYRGVPGLPPERHPVVFARLEPSEGSAA